ncbi:MAG: sulfotransferase domain-containing protein [Bacteroidales bacterium]|nr:sulfotransferase domain-containing protein [Bacteroidales bacterium]
MNENLLKYIKKSNRKSGRHLPNFLIIGPQRTGTTWLSENLRKHPDFLISYPKELYYFTRIKFKTDSKFAENFKQTKLKNGLKEYLVALAEHIYFDYYKTRCFKYNELEWYKSFFTLNLIERIVKNIKSLFKRGEFYKPVLRGEATASYINLDEDVIQELLAVCPDIKCIIIIRDPVERAWSHAKKQYSRNIKRSISKAEEDEIINFFKSDYQIACSKYIDNIDKWLKYIKKENLLVASFKKLDEQPKEFITEILQFLGAEVNLDYFGKDVLGKINKTKELVIPENYMKVLNELFDDESRKIKERFGEDFF